MQMCYSYQHQNFCACKENVGLSEK